MARKVGLRRDQVVAAAAGLADREGVGAVTLARVAAELDVRSPSLYSHVDGLAGLRRALALEGATRLGERVAQAADGCHGAEALTAIAHTYRSFVKEHPGVYAAMLPAPAPDDEELYLAYAAPVLVITGVLAAMGVPDAEAVPIIRAFRSALHGFVSLETGGGFGMPEDIDDSFATLVDVLLAGISGRSTAGAGR
jgi:AcrR family transcriptional regulator